MKGELIKCRGRVCNKCGALIIGYAYLVPVIIDDKRVKITEQVYCENCV